MKKQQILALIMAGTIVTGMAPAAVFGETDAPAVSIEGEAAVAAESEEGAVVEETLTEGTDASQTEDVPAETPAQEPTAEPTQAPTDIPAAEPTAEPAQEPESNPEEIFEAGNTTEMESLDEDGTAAQNAGQIVMKKPDGTQATYGTLAEAIAAADQNVDVADASAVTQIFVTGTVELTETVVIDGQRSISIAAGEAGAVIKRAETLTGDMFKVTGGSAFQFGSGTDASGNILGLTVDGYSTAPDAGGSIVLVETNSSFGMNDGVTLSGNRTSMIGAAIRNIGGTVGLSGGTITDNQSLDDVNGAIIYSEGNAAADATGNYKGDILISGNVTISDDADRALVLNNNGVIRVVGVLGSTTSLRYLVNDPKDGRCVVQAAEGVVLSDVLNQVVYIGDAQYTVDANGYLKAVTTPVESTMELKVEKANGEGVKWVTDTEASLSFHATELGKYYVKVIKQTDKMPTFAEVKASVEGREIGIAPTTVPLTNLDSTSDLYVVVYAEDSRGLEAKKNLVLSLKARKTSTDPTATPTPTTRPALTPKVTESTVTGLEKPLEFYPGKTYSFTVKGAGSDNTDPVKGDVRWVPLYWSSYKNPSNPSQRQSIGSIGHKTGIKRAATFNMYIFFQKYVYDGTQWQPTDVIESMTYQFKSKAIEFSLSPTGTITPTVTDGNGGGSYGGGDGSGDEVTDPEDHADDSSDTGSSSATNARTADNSPIATMMMLASLSLLAGGYVLVRKRKKEI